MKAIILFLTLIPTLYAAPQFIAEFGDYNQSTTDMKEYYESLELDYFSFNKQDLNNKYKINKLGQFQLKDWFRQDWFKLQTEYSFDEQKYINYFNAKTVNQAKINYYSNLTFDTSSRRHVEDFNTMKEWGILNHPPVHSVISDLEIYSKNYKAINYDKVESELLDNNFHKELDKITETELSINNKVSVLEDKYAYEKKVELIKNAKSHILMSSLVFICDSSTHALTKELIKKAKEGIQVYILIDQFISNAMLHTACPNMMKSNGIHLIKAKDFFKYEGNAIYHSKKLVVDFQQAILGGHNMLNADNTSNGTDFKNRDIDLLVKGPMVRDIAKGFLEDYNHFYQTELKRLTRNAKPKARSRKNIPYIKKQIKRLKKQSVTGLNNRVNTLIELERNNGFRGSGLYDKYLSKKENLFKGVCRFVQQSPYKDRTVIGKAYLHYLKNTESYLGIMNPEMLDRKYLTTSERPLIERFDNFEMFNQINDSILKFSDNKSNHIDLITTGPDVAGNEVVAILHEKIKYNLEAGWIRSANQNLKLVSFWNNYYGKPHYANMLKDYVPRKNIDVWTHMSFIHSKIFYFDRIVSSIGSYNFHHNATDHAYENTVFCQDKNLNRQLDEVFVRDMANSIPFKFKSLQP